MELEALLDARPAQRSQIGAWYSQVLDEADRCGLSTSGLAARLGCSKETIYAWRRRLREDQAPQEATASAKLVRVRIAEPAADQNDQRLEIRVGGDRSILVHAAFDPTALAAVVQVLEQC